MSNKHIVLLGRYTILWTYCALVQQLRYEIGRGDVNIPVVCPEAHHFFHGWTAESLTGVVRNGSRMSPLAKAIPRAEFIKGYAVEVDSGSNVLIVKTETGMQVIHFDHLLIGMGSFDSGQIERCCRLETLHPRQSH